MNNPLGRLDTGVLTNLLLLYLTDELNKLAEEEEAHYTVIIALRRAHFFLKLQAKFALFLFSSKKAHTEGYVVILICIGLDPDQLKILLDGGSGSYKFNLSSSNAVRCTYYLHYSISVSVP